MDNNNLTMFLLISTCITGSCWFFQKIDNFIKKK